jgi:hypothetical protein
LCLLSIISSLVIAVIKFAFIGIVIFCPRGREPIHPSSVIAFKIVKLFPCVVFLLFVTLKKSGIIKVLLFPSWYSIANSQKELVSKLVAIFTLFTKANFFNISLFPCSTGANKIMLTAVSPFIAVE